VTFLDATDLPKRADTLQQDMRTTLEPGEKLLWSGFPRQGLMLRAQDAFLIPFSLLWGGFAIFWEYSVIAGEPDVPDQFDLWDQFFVLWGVPFVLFGLYFIFGRFFADSVRRARTIYAITDRRVILLSDFLGHNTRTVTLSGLSDISLAKKANGRGTITFGPANYVYSVRGWPSTSRNTTPAFENIARAEDVLKIIRDAQDASRS
jgi:hypothetical protein